MIPGVNEFTQLLIYTAKEYGKRNEDKHTHKVKENTLQKMLSRCKNYVFESKFWQFSGIT